MTNRYSGICEACGSDVPPNGGTVRKIGRRWIVRHLACDASGRSEVMEVRFGDRSFTRNKRGRCEDAPCCGCCTI